MEKIFLGPAGICISAKDNSTIGSIKHLAELGLAAQEVEFVYGVQMNRPTAKEVGDIAKKLNIKLSIHAPYYINLCTTDKKKLAASKTRIKNTIDRAVAMNANVIVFHAGFYGNLTEEEAFEKVKEGCEEMATKEVLLGLETTGKHSAFGSLEELVKLCKQVKHCVPVIDFAHVFARNFGKIDYGKVFDAIEPLKLKHIHTHFSNIEFTEKGERRHLVLDSQPPFKPLAEEILKRKLNITIISESPALEQDSLKMKRIFESLGYRFEKN